jgi:pimeloyl-ACP methyl ester carboxylesterase
MDSSTLFNRLVPVLVFCSLFCVSAPTSAQSNEQAQMKTWAQNYLRHFKLDAKATPQDIEQLAGLRLKISAPALSVQERQAAYTEAAALIYRLLGKTPTVLDSYRPASIFTRTAHGLLTSGAYQAASQKTAAPGQLGHVEKRGRGPVPMLLIADAVSDWTIYQTFMERHTDRYTMYAVTLPGYGGTPPPPAPQFFDPAATPWLDHAEQALLKLIEKYRLDRPIVAGTQAGVYLAARLAINHPDKLRAAVLINGAVHAGVRDPARPDQPLSLEERQRLLASAPGFNGMLHALLPDVQFAERAAVEQAIKGRTAPLLLSPLGTLALDAERDRELFINGLLGSAPGTYRYLNELLFTDLTTDFKRLKIPALALVSVFDDRSSLPGFTSIDQWAGLKLRYPEIPLTPVLVENARNYLTEDVPTELDQAITAFLAGKPINVMRARAGIMRRAAAHWPASHKSSGRWKSRSITAARA